MHHPGPNINVTESTYIIFVMHCKLVEVHILEKEVQLEAKNPPIPG